MIFYDNHQKGMIRIFNAIIGCYYTIMDWFKRVLFISCKHYIDDLERFYHEKVKIDPLSEESRFRIGEIKDLEERVKTAINDGAVAYVPS